MTETCKYRKTKSGEWVVCGPTTIVRPGAVVTVTTNAGDHKHETIATIGKPFDGLVYGYIDRNVIRPRQNNRPYGERVRCTTGGECWSFSSIRRCDDCGKDLR